MAKKEDIGNQRNKNIEEYGDYSYDTEELSVEELIKRGFKKEHAENLVRKHYISKRFANDSR